MSQADPGSTSPESLGPLHDVPPFALFGGVSDDAWRWLHLEGRDRCPFLQSYLPGRTGDPKFEAHVVGSSGTEMLAKGFEIYELFKSRYEEYAGPLTPSARVLDFGCGFGRVIRFFHRDIAPENLFGIDVDERRLAASGDRWSQLRTCDTFSQPTSQPKASTWSMRFLSSRTSRRRRTSVGSRSSRDSSNRRRCCFSRPLAGR